MAIRLKWLLACCIAVLACVGVTACQTVPITGRSQLLLLSEADEMQMGIQSYQEVVKKSKLSKDPATNEMVKRVGTRIAAATGRTDFQWEFTVIEDPQANAFALPGGKVAVYTGILPITRDETGLAAVLGHEIAHAVARHGAERVSQNLLVQVGLAGTMAAFSKGDPKTRQSVGALLGAGAAVGLVLPWSRSQESEADHLGLIYMAKAGYNPSAARDLWIRMAEASKGHDRPPEFLSTHPAEATRIQQIEAWLPEASQYYRPGPGKR
ncbi:MAG: M48 family metallopeptidase [Candidatus Methylomirabilis oxygeniifera]|uniref:Peptidase M48, Ste24p n=1 Tax=Methylomirabilis oxygeniifera TaxID=671143 RepID=D5MID5_METO1|nr:MAG: M48 family metallopeptidase [Candidatus Methylomirabilis oxyfera]CBE67285.1 Peptidase M48, Ste24p precursor [Candidatus Methylomirabilis oxyfera]